MENVAITDNVHELRDHTPESEKLALDTIGSLTVLGALQASPRIKAALTERIKQPRERRERSRP
jgi:hypothetical protein